MFYVLKFFCVRMVNMPPGRTPQKTMVVVTYLLGGTGNGHRSRSIVGLKAYVGSGIILDGKRLAAIMCFYMQFYHVCSYLKSVSPISFDN